MPVISPEADPFHLFSAWPEPAADSDTEGRSQLVILDDDGNPLPQVPVRIVLGGIVIIGPDAGSADNPAEDRSTERLLIGMLTFALDVCGIFEPTPFCDLSSATLSVSQGDLFGAGMSAMGVVPYLGDTLKITKVPKYYRLLVRALAKAAKDEKFAKKLVGVLTKVEEVLHLLPDTVPFAPQIKRMVREFLDSKNVVRFFKADAWAASHAAEALRAARSNTKGNAAYRQAAETLERMLKDKFLDNPGNRAALQKEARKLWEEWAAKEAGEILNAAREAKKGTSAISGQAGDAANSTKRALEQLRHGLSKDGREALDRAIQHNEMRARGFNHLNK